MPLIDTNQINQVGENVAAIKEQVKMNWPAICAAVVWIRAELKSINAWGKAIVEYSIAHGGIAIMIIKFFWNPPAK